MLEIEIRFYGAFRDYSSQSTVILTVPPLSDLGHLRALLRQRLEILKPGAQPGDLLEKSVFADADDILPADYLLQRSQSLSIIPPVCGG